MCPLAPAPAPIYLPWPWQAPWNWVGFAAFLAFVFWVAIIRRPRWGLARPNIAPYSLRLLRIVAFNSLACIFILGVVVMPSMARNDAWYYSQYDRFSQSQQSCSLDALFTTDAGNQTATSTWGEAAFAMDLLGLVIILMANRRQRARIPLEVPQP